VTTWTAAGSDGDVEADSEGVGVAGGEEGEGGVTGVVGSEPADEVGSALDGGSVVVGVEVASGEEVSESGAAEPVEVAGEVVAVGSAADA
jgi:hypothetical protein